MIIDAWANPLYESETASKHYLFTFERLHENSLPVRILLIPDARVEKVCCRGMLSAELRVIAPWQGRPTTLQLDSAIDFGVAKVIEILLTNIGETVVTKEMG